MSKDILIETHGDNIVVGMVSQSRSNSPGLFLMPPGGPYHPFAPRPRLALSKGGMSVCGT
jgi:hypothetical protein